MQVKIGARFEQALLNTCSYTSLVSKELVKDLKLKIIPLRSNESQVLFAANGNRMKILGTVDLKMTFAGLSHSFEIQHWCKVADNLIHSVLLGIDFLRQNGVIIDYKREFISIANNLLTVPLQMDGQMNVKMITSACIPAHSEAILAVCAPAGLNGKTVLLEECPQQQFNKFAV